MSISNESDKDSFINENSTLPKGQSLVKELEEKWKSIENTNSKYKSISFEHESRKKKN